MSTLDDLTSGALSFANTLANGVSKLNTVIREASGAVAPSTTAAANPATIVNQVQAATAGTATASAAAVSSQAKGSSNGLLIGIGIVVLLLFWKKG